MGVNTKIEWTNHSHNPWIGCSHVSPACDFCYAESMMDHRYGRVEWGGDRKRTSEATRAEPYKWDRAAKIAGKKATVFCLSLGDIWDKEVNPVWRSELFAVIERTPNLIWLLLSKRIGNAEKMCDPLRVEGPLPPNAALGATMINQEEYDRDRMKLYDAGKKLGALFTFASVEPMLGPIVLDKYAPDWIICGGENARQAREMNPQWARDLRDSAARFERPFFLKQMTNKKPIPSDLMIRQFPPQIGA